MVGPLLGLGCRGGRAQSGVQLGQGAVSPLAVLFKCLWLHYLATMAAHHQVEVIMARVEAKDGHICEEKGGRGVMRRENTMNTYQAAEEVGR